MASHEGLDPAERGEMENPPVSKRHRPPPEITTGGRGSDGFSLEPTDDSSLFMFTGSLSARLLGSTATPPWASQPQWRPTSPLALPKGGSTGYQFTSSATIVKFSTPLQGWGISASTSHPLRLSLGVNYTGMSMTPCLLAPFGDIGSVIGDGVAASPVPLRLMLGLMRETPIFFMFKASS
ncbi:hypothetical protein LSAT2_026358 [Lamellibrachia satsuma]|nr:hypothetical protein LSAT2_026358 [Lamellibrachia satsuma]